ncbi:MAG: BON domain-containing protein [Bryobacteraceae bacterium]
MRLLTLLVFSAALYAQAPASRENPGPDRIARLVRRELVTLPFLTAFDNLAFRIDGGTITLEGQVTRPVLKKDAENVVKKVEGVEKVVNNIEVLPLSPNDDDIRAATYRSVFSHPALNRYAIQAQPPIRIIVRNGNVTLIGVVNSQQEKTIAGMQANQVPGVFQVKNELQVEARSKR